MASTHDSKACLQIPPIVVDNYEPKGEYQTHAGLSTYITGSTSAKKAIFLLYDIFGYTSQTLQGADILASQGYVVTIPDLLEGQPPKMEWMARDTDERREKFAAFMTRIRDSKPHVENIHKCHASLKQAFPNVEKWAAIGYCWGGKLVSITSFEGTPWSVGVQTSPAMVDPEDAKKITIPMAMLASEGEPADAVKSFDEALQTPKHVETFGDQVHGWMSARADLNNEKVKKEYERGYQVALDFINKYI